MVSSFNVILPQVTIAALIAYNDTFIYISLFLLLAPSLCLFLKVEAPVYLSHYSSRVLKFCSTVANTHTQLMLCIVQHNDTQPNITMIKLWNQEG